jgi:hypothetical protein
VEREFEIERCDLPARGRSTEKSIEQMLQTYLRVDTQKMRSASREQGLVQSLLAEQFVRKPMATLQASEVAAYRDRHLQIVKAASVRRQLAVLNHAFRVAEEEEWGWAIPRHFRRRIPLPIVSTKVARRLRPAGSVTNY